MADPAITGDKEKEEKKTPTPAPAATTEGGSVDAPNVDPNKAAPAEGEGDNKTELEKAQGEVEQLTKDIKIANDLQSQADRKSREFERENKRLKKDVKPSTKKEGEKKEGEGEKEPDNTFDDMGEAENKVARLLIDPKYRPLLDSDPTLLDSLQRQPLLFVDDYIDAGDALDQTRDYLDERLSKLETATAEEAAKAEKDKGENKEEETGTKPFNVGSPNVRGGPGGAKTAEDYRKEGNTDAAVETSILGKMNIPRK